MIDGLVGELLLLLMGAAELGWLLQITVLGSVLVVVHFVSKLALTTSALIGNVLLDVIFGSNQNFLNSIGLHIYNCINLFLRQVQPKLL